MRNWIILCMIWKIHNIFERNAKRIADKPLDKRKDLFRNKLKNNMETENEQGLRIAGALVFLQFSRHLQGMKNFMKKYSYTT